MERNLAIARVTPASFASFRDLQYKGVLRATAHRFLFKKAVSVSKTFSFGAAFQGPSDAVTQRLTLSRSSAKALIGPRR